MSDIHEILTLADGQQVIVSRSKGVRVEMSAMGNPVVSTSQLAITDAQADRLRIKSQTHHIEFDTITKEMKLTLKAKKQDAK